MTSPCPSPITVRGYESGDEEQILAAFNRAFAAADPGFEPRSLAAWRWRFLENPAGRRIRLALDGRGAVVAQFAGLPQRALLDGEPAVFTQAVDSLAAPRADLGRSPFVRAGERFRDDFRGDAWMWGYPERAALRIGRRCLGYERVRAQTALRGEPHRLEPGRAGAGVEVEETTGFPAAVDGLFARVGARQRAIAVRDAETLDWRFARHPEHDYALGLARAAGRLAGYAVCRPGRFDGESATLVCDWLAEPAAAPALVAWLAARARAGGSAPLLALFPPWSPEWARFQEAGFRVVPTRRTLVGKSFARGRDARWFARHWYVTLGDSDLC